MKSGWLWFDNSAARTLHEKVAHAAQQYRLKFGRDASVCYLCCSDDEALEIKANGVRVVAAKNIPPHHFLLETAEPDQPLAA
jgi:hypothetical protein